MARPTRTPRGPAWAVRLAVCTVGASLVGACSEANTRPDPEGEVLRLGRVHLVLEPSEDRVAADEASDPAEAQLEVTARFAFVRGLDEDFVRARVGMPVLAHEQVPVSECVLSDSLTIDPGEPSAVGPATIGMPDPSDFRELVLVDAGDLTVRIGDTDVDVPLALVPDLLPYMSGVEYLQETEMGPLADAVPPVTIQARGSQTDDLPPFLAEGRVPNELALGASEADLEEQFEGALVIRWQRASEGEPITMRLLPLLGDEPIGEEITCVIADRGEARIDIARLHTLGLPAQADAVRLTASRVAVTNFDAGDFTGSELVIERRDRLYIPLR